MVKLTAEVPVDVDIRVYALARSLGVPKRELVGRMLEAGCQRYGVDRHFREVILSVCGVEVTEPAA